nr:hypothetical protein [Tanacetum cinerariifolium]
PLPLISDNRGRRVIPFAHFINNDLEYLRGGKLSNLTVKERFAFNVSLKMFTRSIVIQRRVEDLQLGVESYQNRLNLTKPDTYRSDLKRREAYTAYSNPKGFIYQNKDKKNRLMRIDELHKFSNGTLNDVRNALDDQLKGIRMQYLPQTIWRKAWKNSLEEGCMRETSGCCKGPYDSSYAAPIFNETPFFKAFLVIADVSKIYMQEFWATATVHHHFIWFKMDNKKHTVNLESFEEMLHICPRLLGQTFDEPPFEEEILAFLRLLGYSEVIRRLTDVNINKLHQPWRSFTAIINKCLSGKSSGYDSLRLSQAQFVWGFYHKRNVYFAYLLWEDFVYQVEHKDTKKSNEMYYSRFTKVIIHHFMSKDLSIPKRNKVNWHYVRDDQMFTTIKLVSKHQNTQQFGAMLPIELTNAKIRNSDAYKEYYAVATGATPTKTKASVWKTKSSSDTTVTPPLIAAAGTRLFTFAKCKQPAKTSKAKKSDEEISWKSSDEGDDDDDDDNDDKEGEEFIHPSLSTHDEEATRDEESFDPIPKTLENTDDEGNGEENLGMNVVREEGQDEEDEEDNLYRDVNINLGRGVQMADVHRTQEFEDSYMTLTSVNPDGQQQSSSVSSQFVTSMLNPTLDAGIENLYTALFEAYESDKIILDTYGDTVTLKRRRDDDADKDEEPSVGSDRGYKRQERSQSQQALQRRKLPGVLTRLHKGPNLDKHLQASLQQQRSQCRLPMRWKSPHIQSLKQVLMINQLQNLFSILNGFLNKRNLQLQIMIETRLFWLPTEAFNPFLMNRLKVETLTPELLAEPTYELIKGSCKSLVELEFFLEEVYKAMTNQLDWVNPKGQQYPHNLLKPLPLIPNSRGRRVIPFDHFINNDLEYLRGGASSRKYTTSVTKTKTADYGHIKWIEDLGHKHQQFYGFAVNGESTRDVYSKRRIIAVTELKIVEWHNYKHLDWITVRRDDDKLYKFKEGDFKRLRMQDIEDMLLLLVQGKLTNLTVEERFAFNVSLRMFTRSIVIQRRVGDLQFGVESYQKKLNLTILDTDGTLTDVRTALDDCLKGIRMKYLPQTIWRKSDKERAAAMIQAIDKQLKTRRIMRSLERFVGERLYEGDFRMLQQTI